VIWFVPLVTQTFTSPITVVPKGQRGKPFPWGGLLVLSSAVFLSVTAEMLPTGLLPEMSAELGVQESQVGFLVSIFAFAVVFTSIPLGHLTRRMSRHRLIVFVLVIIAITSAVSALAPNYGVLVGARIVGGMAHGLFWAVMGAYSGYLVPKEQLGRAVALTTGGGTLAFVMGVPLGTMLGHAVGWRAAFGAIAILCITGAVLMLWLLPRVSRPAAAEQVKRHASGRRVMDATVPAVALTCILAAVIMIGHYTFYTFIAPYLTGEMGVDTSNVALLLAVYGGAGALGLLLTGTVFGKRPTLGIALAIGASAVSVLVMAVFAGTPAVSVSAFVLWGLMFGVLPPLLGTQLLHVASPAIRDTASAVYSTSFNVGIGGGALAGAVILENLGLSALPFTYLGALVVAAVLIAVSTIVIRRRSATAASAAAAAAADADLAAVHAPHSGSAAPDVLISAEAAELASAAPAPEPPTVVSDTDASDTDASDTDASDTDASDTDASESEVSSRP
jgi:DHA1 family inner membrane transport protein